jgi:hypothetical protein
MRPACHTEIRFRRKRRSNPARGVLPGYIGIALLASLATGGLANAESIRLTLPVTCELGHNCVIQNYVDLDTSNGAQDYTCGTRTYDGHNGTDFRLTSMGTQRAGVHVVAAADGTVARMRDGVADASVKQSGKPPAGRECGNGIVITHPGGWETQYCHMERGSLMVKPGEAVKAGQKLGRIGLSGMTEYPHLHFTVRHQGNTVDPFAYNESGTAACGKGTSLWDQSLRSALGYHDRSVLNTGFAAEAVSMDAIENESIDPPSSAQSPAIVAYVRAIGLKTGDKQGLVLRGPKGQVLAENRTEPLDRPKAQTMLFAGRKQPAGGWERGRYQATYTVELDGRQVLKRDWSFELK